MSKGTIQNKRKAADTLGEEEHQRREDKNKEQHARDHYVKKEPKLRIRSYCCSCTGMTGAKKGSVSACQSCGHDRCAQCLHGNS